MAREMLETVPSYQRRVRQKDVDRIALAIRSGQWRENGSTIVFNRKGELVNGQHRLSAVVQADHSVWALVVRGIDATIDTFRTIDDGRSRTIADFMKVRHANHVAAVARLFWLVVHGKLVCAPDKPPILDTCNLAEPHLEAMAESQPKTHKASRVTGVGTLLGFLWFYYTHILELNEAKVTEFFERLGDGVGLDTGSPMGALRNRCLSQRVNTKIERKPMMALVIKALNAHMNNKKMRGIYFDASREEFPPLYGQSSNADEQDSSKPTKITEAMKTLAAAKFANGEAPVDVAAALGVSTRTAYRMKGKWEDNQLL